MKLFRLLFILISALSIVGCKRTSTKKNDLDKEKLKGKVKSLIEIDYYTNSKDTFTNRHFIQSKRIKFFDQNGFLSEVQFYNNTSSHLEMSEKQLFNTVNNITTCQDSCFLFGNNKFTHKSITSLDESGNEILDSIFDNYDNIQTVVKDSYDKYGNISTNDIYNQYGNLVHNVTYEFECDAKGRIIKCKGYNSKGTLEDKSVFTYDERGNKIKSKSYEDGKLIYLDSCFYDKNGEVIEGFSYTVSRNIWQHGKTKITYDAHGNWIRKEPLNTTSKQVVTQERRIEYY